MDDMKLKDRRVVVMGLGRFGGGIGVTRWLVEQGAQVTVTDSASRETLAESIDRLQGCPVTFDLGGHDPSHLDACDLLVVSPAVNKAKSDYVQQARRRAIPLSSEMNLFLERCPARCVVGVTGSAGKSTTTAMIGEILTCAAEEGRFPAAWVGGNIGKSLLDDLAAMSADDAIVLELSSFQLEDVAALPWSPPIALVTNLKPNHLDRHGTMKAYISAKMNIVRHQDSSGVVLVPDGVEAVARAVKQAGGGARMRRYAFDAAFQDTLAVPGAHNRVNAAAAIEVGRVLGLPDDLIREGLQRFRGLPDRLELVGEVDGVRYINDSKSTTPESAIIALEAFEAPVIMLVGGGDKKMPFDELGRRLADRAKAVVCYGETGPKLFGAVSQSCGEKPSIAVQRADGFQAAVRQARELAVPGDVVVLSPACTSYDMFTNYEERGEAFRQLVRGWLTSEAT